MAVWLYLGMTSWVVLRGDPGQITRLAEQEEGNAVFALAVMSVGATISLAAIVIEPASAKSLHGNQRLMHYALTGTTVLGSWLLVSVRYSFHYAYLYYRSHSGGTPLRFPDETTEAGHCAFFISLVHDCRCSPDVRCQRPFQTARKAVLAQSVPAFVFNAAIIGMSINIAAGLVGSQPPVMKDEIGTEE